MTVTANSRETLRSQTRMTEASKVNIMELAAPKDSLATTTNRVCTIIRGTKGINHITSINHRSQEKMMTLLLLVT